MSLSYHSADGEEGYPGNMDVLVTYAICDSSLIIKYDAVSDKDTVCSLTNHSYFNLKGHGDVSDHMVSVNADRFTPVNEEGIPTGEIAQVFGKMDLKSSFSLMNIIDDGYDDNYLLNRKNCATCLCPETGILMCVTTDMPAMQFYTGNGLKNGLIGKNGAIYNKCSGLCFETQQCPDSPNKKLFPSPILKANERMHSETSFSFTNQ